jgi:hypothetical protein
MEYPDLRDLVIEHQKETKKLKERDHTDQEFAELVLKQEKEVLYLIYNFYKDF